MCVLFFNNNKFSVTKYFRVQMSKNLMDILVSSVSSFYFNDNSTGTT